MLIADHIYDLLPDDLFLRVRGLAELTRFYLKIEGFNAGGSIKLKTARALVQAAEDSGVDLTRTHFIESTSGNLGVALAVICSAKRYRLTCVVDPNANAATVSLMQALGAEVVTVRERDAHGGFLGTRIAYIQRRLLGEPGLYWLNQYTNPGNPTAHERSTAPAVLAAFGRVDYLVVGVGTSGTLMGCVDYFRRWSPQTRIVAVDALGSVNFESTAAPRFIPGLGASRRAELLDPYAPDDVVLVPEWETVRDCRWLAASTGFLAGGSTGTVVAAVRHLAREIPDDATVVAIAPDLGERYLSTVYDDAWVAERRLDRPGRVSAQLLERQRDVLV